MLSRDAYYNEIDPFAAQWLRNLISAKLIARGTVDERSIVDVTPADLAGFAQCHFFAGIGIWSHALRLSGWGDSRPVWTGSCPCQPFSDIGEGRGFDDERHLWPVWFDLIRQCRPSTVFGEQVASKAGLEWVDLVQADMETAGYAFGAFDLCAAGVGAPHIRQRLFFVGHTEHAGLEGHIRSNHEGEKPGWLRPASGGSDTPSGIPDDWSGKPVPDRNEWKDFDWLSCRDGRYRPVQTGTFPLGDGNPNRMGRLRAYGNAIVPQVAQQFIEAFMECKP